MESAAQGGLKLEPGDQALALAIAGETLRRLPLLDRLIDGATRQALPDDSKARMVLRLALAQRIALNVPDHALEAARRAIVRRPPLDLSFRSDEEARAFAAAEYGVNLAERHVRLADQRAVNGLPGFTEGRWWIQDLASTLPARMIPAEARRVLDTCAAPGGKTLQLAATGNEVTALDRSESRLARLRDNLARTGLHAEVVVGDALDWEPDEPFDAVLVDAPCSATGTFRRHPEVLYRASERIIADGADLQARLLAQAANWVRPGGSLVYAVCSLEPQEGEEQVTAFLAGHADFTEAERRRVLPGEEEEAGGMDGFFTARLVRQG
jgi:16S rRNA (cytosine967-C5)-methyltransferase